SNARASRNSRTNKVGLPHCRTTPKVVKQSARSSPGEPFDATLKKLVQWRPVSLVLHPAVLTGRHEPARPVDSNRQELSRRGGASRGGPGIAAGQHSRPGW